MKKIFYWGPFIENKIATIRAINNSVIGINRYSKIYKAKIINTIGEWNEFIDSSNKEFFINSNFNLIKILPKYGFIRSRISYLIISFISFFQLKKILSNDKPDFFVIHLLVTTPLLLFYLFRFKSKLIIRISGKPKLNFFRKNLWKFTSKNVYKVFCPTNETRELLVKKNIFNKDIIFTLRDPIIDLKKFKNLKSDNNFKENFKKNNIILAGRLTKQKNFSLIVKAIENNDYVKQKYKIYIFGNGELEKELRKEIVKRKLEKIVFLMGYSSNIIKYMKNSKLFILTSLWEDPGFVLIEAAMCNLSIIASNCPSGPNEIISKYEDGGLLFKNNDENSLNTKLIEYFKMENHEILKKKIYAKKNIKDFTVFNHTKNLENYLKIS
jgi:glycosyltransferase involved in cell wall biosynthesis